MALEKSEKGTETGREKTQHTFGRHAHMPRGGHLRSDDGPSLAADVCPEKEGGVLVEFVAPKFELEDDGGPLKR